MTSRLLVVALLLTVGCDDDTTPSPDSGALDLGVGDLSSSDATGDMTTAANVARGEYLVKHLLMCGDCHTTPDIMGQPSTDPTKFLAGGRSFTLPGAGPDGGVGTVYAANLTPDPTTGLGTWDVSYLVDALTVGVDKDGNPLWPIMPYYMFGNLTPDDAMSIALYLKSVPAQSNAVPENTATPPAGAAPRIDDSAIVHTTLPAADPGFAAAERGRYLSKVACIECHTQHLPPGGATVLDQTRQFAGGVLFHLGPLTTVSANLTPHATGLVGWTPAEIVAALKTNKEKGTGADLCPPMPGGAGRLGGLTDGDLNDIAGYVHTLPPVANGPFGCTDAGVPFGLDGGI